MACMMQKEKQENDQGPIADTTWEAFLLTETPGSRREGRCRYLSNCTFTDISMSVEGEGEGERAEKSGKSVPCHFPDSLYFLTNGRPAGRYSVGMPADMVPPRPTSLLFNRPPLFLPFRSVSLLRLPPPRSDDHPT